MSGFSLAGIGRVARVHNAVGTGQPLKQTLDRKQEDESEPAPVLTSEASRPARSISAREAWCVGLIVAGFLAVNLFTASRYPTVWMDEVGYTDPAANWYFGHGFTSACWPQQPYGKFWAGNVPLHQCLLTGWFHLFGFSLGAARSMNQVLLAAACMVVWLASRRSGLLRTGAFSGLAMFLINCDTAVMMSSRSARPDCVTILLAALAFLAFTIPRPGARRMALALIGVLAPAAGIQLVLFGGIFAGLLLAFRRGRDLTDFICLGMGILAGSGLLFGIYEYQGVWGNFVAGLTKWNNIGITRFGVMGRLMRMPGALIYDKTEAGLVVVLLALLAANISSDLRLRSGPLWFGITSCLAVPPLMMALAKFAIYYGWMTCLPLVICLASVIESLKESGSRVFLCRVAIGVSMLVVLPGLPMRMLITAFKWRERDYSEVVRYAQPYSGHAGWLLANEHAYFALKNRTNIVVWTFYLLTATAEEKSRIQLAIMGPDGERFLAERVGGEWKQIGAPLDLKWDAFQNSGPLLRNAARRLNLKAQDLDYDLRVYERLPEGEPAGSAGAGGVRK
jgi:hypothetical protein